MTTQEVKRKLAAILSADVKGYSRLMGEDEVATLKTLSAYFQIMTTLIQKHQGRVLNIAGDNLLADFESVVDAVQCGVEIQKELRSKNAELAEGRRVEFRIGVNLGDVIREGDTIYGDGVNIAERVQSLAEGGGICISGPAFDQVENKLTLGYEYLGEQTVKNIAKPVRVYRVLMETETAPQRGLEVASKEKMAFPLPDLPSIAVLPFENMSGDPKQEFLSDGITETIITALSKVPNLFVIARNSTFTYKGKPVKVKQVSEELGVQYVLEGSFQRSGDRIRITTQLIDALTGHHLWAERYDRDLTDIFALQDEITIKVLNGVQVKLAGGDISRAEKYAEKYYKGKQGLDCYLKLMQGMGYWARYNIEDNNMARRIIEEAIAMCPEDPLEYSDLGWIYYFDYMLGNTKSPRETIEKGIELAQKALAMDDSLAGPHGLLSRLYGCKGEHDKAIAEGERAVALNPSDWFLLTNYGNSLSYVGRQEEAIPLLQKVIRLNPRGPVFIYLNLGRALRMTGRFEEAVLPLKKAIQLAPNHVQAHVSLTVTYNQMGREKEARAEAAELLRINPKFSVDNYAKTLPYKDQSEIDELANALRKAGLK
jgi:adenylate cyclase